MVVAGAVRFALEVEHGVVLSPLGTVIWAMVAVPVGPSSGSDQKTAPSAH